MSLITDQGMLSSDASLCNVLHSNNRLSPIVCFTAMRQKWVKTSFPKTPWTGRRLVLEITSISNSSKTCSATTCSATTWQVGLLRRGFVCWSDLTDLTRCFLLVIRTFHKLSLRHQDRWRHVFFRGRSSAQYESYDEGWVGDGADGGLGGSLYPSHIPRCFMCSLYVSDVAGTSC